jgi:N-methylhydantoinase B
MTITEPARVALGRQTRHRAQSADDPVQTAILRSGLDAAGNEMKASMRRSAFSPIIYDALDFACALYDTDVRLLAQGQTLPIFQGTLSFCVDAAIEAIGLDGFRPGDVVVNTDGYSMGTHGQDVTIVVPGFVDGELLGFACIKAHHMDIAGIAVFATDTTDVWQEGTIYPSVRLYRGGERDSDLWRLMLANTRLPASFAGDLSAQIGAARIGLQSFERVVQRFGVDRFRDLVEYLFDTSESRMRDLIAELPNGRWTEHAVADDNGVTDASIPYSVDVEIDGEKLIIDLRSSPPLQEGPVNCPIGTVVSTVRCAAMSLLGGQETANEGFFRPIEILTTPGTMFHAEAPAPMILYSWITENLVDMIHRVVARHQPERVTAQFGTDVAAILVWGTDEDGNFWADGQDFIGGQGASIAYGDGASPLMLIADSGIRTTPCEVWESRNPMLVERFELIPDTGGPGEFRGGNGVRYRLRALKEFTTTIAFERTKSPVLGINGGGDGTPSSITITYPDGRVDQHTKASQITIPADAVLDLVTGGGGGCGEPRNRAPEAVLADLAAGYVTAEHVRRWYPHVEVIE